MVHIDDVHHPLDGGAGFDVSGPVGKCDDPRSTFIQRSFAFAIWSVVTGDDDFGHVGDCPREHGVARAAVVSLEDDEGIVAQPFLVERFHYAADLVVHGRDGAGVGSAAGVGDVLVLV